jgi:putative thiamine transport system ATP-binding protein
MSLNIHLQSLRTPSRVLLENLTLEVPAGTVHTVMGPSGSGKSSLLAAVCGTLEAGLQFEGRIT